MVATLSAEGSCSCPAVAARTAAARRANASMSALTDAASVRRISSSSDSASLLGPGLQDVRDTVIEVAHLDVSHIVSNRDVLGAPALIPRHPALRGWSARCRTLVCRARRRCGMERLCPPHQLLPIGGERPADLLLERNASCLGARFERARHAVVEIAHVQIRHGCSATGGRAYTLDPMWGQRMRRSKSRLSAGDLAERQRFARWGRR